ncbi:MAG: sulfatase-like hydrolase/transferase [Pseudomonadota bacterium]
MQNDARPDILFLMPDQLRPDFLSCYGADFVQTPNIDALAAAGTRYETCISPSPICVPARASLLTGQSAQACGVLDNLHWPRPDRARMGVQTWPERLAAAGYHTAAIGKMHFYPWDASEGFAQRIIAEDKRHLHIDDDYAAALRAAGLAKRHAGTHPGYHAAKGAYTDDTRPGALEVDRWVATQAAQALLDAPADRPLAMMVGFPGPHCPYDPPSEALARIDPGALPKPHPPTPESERHRDAFVASYRRAWADLDYAELDADQIRGLRHHYAALVERLDADVGLILDALDHSGRAKRTIVVFASDHGDYLGDFGLVGKTTFHEPSIRVPLIVRDPRAKVIGGVSDQLATLPDLHPTFLDWAGLVPPAYCDGTVLGRADPERIVTGVTAHGVMARDAAWKLVRYRNGTEALFHLPDETTDRMQEAPKVRARLDQALTTDLLRGFLAAHADKRVAEAQAPEGHAFHRRGWQRPYPAAVKPHS